MLDPEIHRGPLPVMALVVAATVLLMMIVVGLVLWFRLSCPRHGRKPPLDPECVGCAEYLGASSFPIKLAGATFLSSLFIGPFVALAIDYFTHG